MFLNAHISKSNSCFNMKSSTYYFHMKTNILADFQICVSGPLIRWLNCRLRPGKYLQSVKSVQIRSYFWSVFSCIWTEYGYLRTRNNSVFGHISFSESFRTFTENIFLEPIFVEVQNYERFREISGGEYWVC